MTPKSPNRNADRPDRHSRLAARCCPRDDADAQPPQRPTGRPDRSLAPGHAGPRTRAACPVLRHRQPGRRCLPADTHRRSPPPHTPSPGQIRRRRGRSRSATPRRPQRDRAMNTTLSSPEAQARPDATLSSVAARPAGEDVEQLSVHDSDSQADGATPTMSAVLDTITRQQLALVITTYRVRSDSPVHWQSAAVRRGSGCRGCPCVGQARAMPAVFAGAGWCRRPERRRRRTAIGSFPPRTAPGTATRTRRLGAAGSGGYRIPPRARRR